MTTIDSIIGKLDKTDARLPPETSRIATFSNRVADLLFPDGAVSDAKLRAELRAIAAELGTLLRDVTAIVRVQEPVQEAAGRFLEALPAIQAQSRLDVAAALRGDPAARDASEVIRYYPGFRATLLYRIAHTLHGFGVPYVPRGITEYAHSHTGVDIHPGAKIGAGLFIDHGTGVVIGETAEIGDDVKLYQGVTLGARSFKSDASGKVIREAKRHPTLEDRVTVYANATILGGKTVIGSDSVIGANVWLMDSVEPGSMVGIEPPVIRRQSRAKR